MIKSENTLPDKSLWRNTRLQRHKTPEQRFWEKVNKSGSIPKHRPELGNCWEWATVSEAHPYGTFKVNGIDVKPHRFSWMLHNGKIPEGEGVLHKCDNERCVRPEHLFTGDQKVNVNDCHSKGRSNTAMGSRHGESKLTEKKVLQIKKMIHKGIGTSKIANKFNVVLGTIGHIKAGRSWKHVCLEVRPLNP